MTTALPAINPVVQASSGTGALSAFPLRPDLQVIADLIPRGTRVLDLGCGNVDLLDHLIRHRQAKGRGVELSEVGVLACVRRGLSVRQGNLNEGLADYPDASFDYVILSQTLPFLSDPPRILGEMLRVGKQAIISFPNWGYWRCRLHLLLTGCMPETEDLPHRWYDTPRMQAFTITDFGRFCRQVGIRIHQEVYLTHGRRAPLLPGVRRFKNLLATTAVFVLESQLAMDD
jgi:methionine biosynthesis protein MetW